MECHRIQFQQPHVLLDIEGTTSSIAFVKVWNFNFSLFSTRKRWIIFLLKEGGTILQIYLHSKFKINLIIINYEILVTRIPLSKSVLNFFELQIISPILNRSKKGEVSGCVKNSPIFSFWIPIDLTWLHGSLLSTHLCYLKGQVHFIYFWMNFKNHI